MMSRAALLAAAGLTISLVGCEEKKSGFTVGQKATADGCDLTLDALPGTEWILLRINPDRSETPDSHARGKFYEEGGTLKLKYNVASVADVYTYNCETKGEELTCKEEPKVKDWCQALVAGGAEECTLEMVRGIDGNVTQDEFDKGWEKAQTVIAQFKGSDENWEKFKFQNNNLGNKLQGLFYAKIDKRTCRLRVTDNYMTIYDGKRIEDSNPVGTNPFVKNDQGELLWEHCENREDLIALKEAEYPKDPSKVGHHARYEVGQEFHVWYLADKARYQEEGCSYSFDTWVNGKPHDKGLVPDAVEARRGKTELHWHHAFKFDQPSASAEGDIITYVARTKCADGKEKKTVSCAAVMVQ